MGDPAAPHRRGHRPGPDADVAAIDGFVAPRRPAAVADAHSGVHGRDPEELLAEVAPRVGPERILDLLLRNGPYALTLADLEAAPHGIDLGPLEPRLPEVLRTASGMIELAPEPLVADVARLHEALAEPVNGAMVLVGRRDLRSNNSWMHNLPMLVQWQAALHRPRPPDDAERLGVVDGAPAVVRSRAGAVVVPAEVTDDVMPGVVSIPHGWGHDQPGADLGVAGEHAGTNSNVLTDELVLEPLSDGDPQRHSRRARAGVASPMRKVAVLGGGVAGLSAAHQLVERGFSVTVYESSPRFAARAQLRGARVGHRRRHDLPAEHGFRFFPGFYRHLPDTMKRIPGPRPGHHVFDER